MRKKNKKKGSQGVVSLISDDAQTNPTTSKKPKPKSAKKKIKRNKEQGTRNKEQGTRNKEQGTRNKEQGTRQNVIKQIKKAVERPEN